MKRGVRILGGGDYGFMITPHGKNARDLDHFIKHCDMPPMESILTMTKTAVKPWTCRIDWGRSVKASSLTYC